MSPVNGLAQLPGWILLSVHMGNLSSVDWDGIQERQPKWWNMTIAFAAVVALWTLKALLIKAYPYSPNVEMHTRQKLSHCSHNVAKAKLFRTKSRCTMEQGQPSRRPHVGGFSAISDHQRIEMSKNRSLVAVPSQKPAFHQNIIILICFTWGWIDLIQDVVKYKRTTKIWLEWTTTTLNNIMYRDHSLNKTRFIRHPTHRLLYLFHASKALYTKYLATAYLYRCVIEKPYKNRT